MKEWLIIFIGGILAVVFVYILARVITKAIITTIKEEKNEKEVSKRAQGSIEEKD